MRVRVFSQHGQGRVDVPALAQSAARFFGTALEASAPDGVRMALASGAFVRCSVTARAATEADLDDARAAEQRGRAGGMAALAERCPWVWELDGAGASDDALWTLAAIAASVALGPVLPEDGATLVGVRGARERAEQAARR